MIKIDGRTMTEDEIEELIFNCYDSTDDLDDDEDDIPTTSCLNHSKNMPNIQCIEEEDVPESAASVSTVIESVSTNFSEQPATSKTDSSCPLAHKFRNVVIDPASATLDKFFWKKGTMVYYEEEIKFRGNSSTPKFFKELETPFQIWSQLFPEYLEKLILDETIKYSGENESFRFDVFDLRKFTGILFYMTYYNLPNVRDYWSDKNDRCVNIVKQQMPRARFEKIRQYLHFNDKSNAPAREDPAHDRLYLIRPVIDTLNNTFESIPKLERLSVDEQMCSTQIGHFMKQYLPSKPKK